MSDLVATVAVAAAIGMGVLAMYWRERYKRLVDTFIWTLEGVKEPKQ